MAYIVSFIPPFYSNNTSAYSSPFYPSYTTNIPPSPYHFYPSEVSSPNLSLNLGYSPPSPSYYTNGSEAIPNFDGSDDAYGWILFIETYFKRRGTPEATKVAEAVTALHGPALQWWFERYHYSKMNWDWFTVIFLWQFKPEYRDILPLLEDDKEEVNNNESLCPFFQAHTINTVSSTSSSASASTKPPAKPTSSFVNWTPTPSPNDTVKNLFEDKLKWKTKVCDGKVILIQLFNNCS